MARKKSGQPHNRARKKADSEQSKSSEEWIDMGYELRKAYAETKQNKRDIDADRTFRSGARRGRGQAPGRTDGRRYG